jgi:hypothetical protein
MSQTYHGNCHCGAFKYHVDLPAEKLAALACNCSYCTRSDSLWILLNDAKITVERGSLDDLSVYLLTFNGMNVLVRGVDS